MSTKDRVIVALAFLSLISGAIDQYFYPGEEFPPTALAFLTIMALLIFLWYRLDAAEVGYRRSAWLDIGVVGIAIVALPYYLVRSRGAKKGIVGVGALLLMYVASVLLSWFGSYLAYYVLQSG